MINSVSSVDDVSVELSSFKNINIQEGGLIHGATTTAKSNWSQILDAVVNPINDARNWKRFIPSWDVIFIVSSAFAVFIDPLICYIPVIVEDRKCYFWDQTLMWSFLTLRSALDLIYAMDCVVFLRRSRDNGTDKFFGAAWIKFFGGPNTRISKLLNHKRSLVFLGILPRVCAALPILEAIILIGKYAFEHVDNVTLFYLIPIQYSLRAYNLYRWLDRHSRIDTAIKRFLKAILDFLPFILAAHLFGALWYYFALDQELTCWSKHLCDPANDICDDKWASNYNFYCYEYNERDFAESRVDMAFLNKSCIVEVTKDVPTLPFDFGIYLYALQSDLTRSRDLPMKILQCFWWGLRNLSSFGSNLQTSFYKDEIIFSIVMSISGLALFLVYLNARVQGSQKVSDQHKLTLKKEIVYPEIINQVQNMYRFRLDLLTKVSMLVGIDGEVLKAICDHLKPVTYGDDFYIVREGELVRKMVFITHGSALMYTNSNGGTNACRSLERDDFYGEELINWAFKFASFSELPISTKTVLSQTKVEALAIPANRLKSIVEKFWWHFKRELTASQLEQFAASSLQVAWRRYCARIKAKAELAGRPG